MSYINEEYARHRSRELLIAAERHRLASQAARCRRWRRLSAYADTRMDRAQARFTERSDAGLGVWARI